MNANESDVAAELEGPNFSAWLKSPEVWADYRNDLQQLAYDLREDRIRLMLKQAYQAGYMQRVKFERGF
jgi:hypothetical protein